MIWYYIILFFTSLFNVVFSWLGTVTALPTILGFDTDAAMTLSMNTFYFYVGVFWPIAHLMIGATFYFGYRVAKNIVMRFFFGHRAPG